MKNVRGSIAKMALAMVMAGSLATAVPAVAGAATTATSTTAGHHLRHDTGLDRQRSCTREKGRLAFELRRQKQFAAETAVFSRLEAAATKAGNTQLATYWGKVVSRRAAYTGHQQARFQARVTHDAKAKGLVGGKCS